MTKNVLIQQTLGWFGAYPEKNKGELSQAIDTASVRFNLAFAFHGNAVFSEKTLIIIVSFSIHLKTLVDGGKRECGKGVQASISKPTPFIYLTFEKMDPFMYLII